MFGNAHLDILNNQVIIIIDISCTTENDKFLIIVCHYFLYGKF